MLDQMGLTSREAKPQLGYRELDVVDPPRLHSRPAPDVEVSVELCLTELAVLIGPEARLRMHGARRPLGGSIYAAHMLHLLLLASYSVDPRDFRTRF